jgi:hypothetical protein
MSKEIQLPNGSIVTVDDEDYPMVASFKWHSEQGRNTEYAVRSAKNSMGRDTSIRMHRQILQVRRGEIIDHIDHNGLNNCKSNLRVCTNQENVSHQRKRKGASSQYKGVTWNKQKQKWQAQIKVNYKNINLGLFETEADAALAFNQAAIHHFGEFAVLNGVVA